MKRLNNKGIIDTNILGAILYSIWAIIVIAAIVFSIYSNLVANKNAKEKEIEKRIEVEALMKNDDYVYFYNGIKIDSETAKDLLLNSKCSFYKEEGTMNIYIEKDE